MQISQTSKRPCALDELCLRRIASMTTRELEREHAAMSRFLEYADGHCDGDFTEGITIHVALIRAELEWIAHCLVVRQRFTEKAA